MDSKKMLSPSEAAPLIGATSKHVRQLILAGELNGFDISLNRRRSSWRVSVDAIAEFLGRRRHVKVERASRRPEIGVKQWV